MIIMFIMIMSTIAYGVTHVLFWAICDSNFFPILWTPKTLYDKIKINWFGAVVLYIIYIIICPIFFICSLGVIGRK